MYLNFLLTDITRRSPFQELFPMREDTLAVIADGMATSGFDDSKPLDVWRDADGALILIDGHTRFAAAQKTGLEQVRCYVHQFPDEDAALDYAIRNQRARRNLTDAEILACVAVLDERKRSGERTDLASCEARSGRSSEACAEKLGVSRVKVEKARTVLDHADAETREAVRSGSATINAAYVATQQQRREVEKKADELGVADELVLTSPAPAPARLLLPLVTARYDAETRTMWTPTPEEIVEIKAQSSAVFNSQKGNDNIEWARWSWNPVTGCLHACDFCYARDIANRFYQQGFAPTFLPERLAAPSNTKPPTLRPDAPEWDKIGYRNVFVCSMADLFGKWVPAEIIRYVLAEVAASPQWTFLFLTKFPERYEEFAGEFPANTWVGTTTHQQAAVRRAERAFAKLVEAGHEGIRWLSVEPMQEPLEFRDLSVFDWVVIGGASRSSQTPEFVPPFEWHADLWRQAREAGCAVYHKTNLGIDDRARLREYPQRMGK
jgi:protein gp37/ParB-like chromosome segregation protein Spo0J